MASSKNAKEDRRRRREYEARVVVRERQDRRAKRDNIVAFVALGLVAALAAAAQITFFTVGPGSLAAAPTATAAPTTAPEPSLAEGRTWTGTLTLNDTLALGISLDGAAAPQAVANMIALGEDYYGGTACHRLTTEGIFVLQCGDPEGTGAGGPGYSWGPIENAPADDLYPAGTIAMARQGKNALSMGSQFFIVYEDSTIPSDIAGGYTVLGTVTSGLDEFKAQIVAPGVADGASDGPPVAPAVITGLTLE